MSTLSQQYFIFILVLSVISLIVFAALKIKWVNRRLDLLNRIFDAPSHIKTHPWLWIISLVSIVLIRDFMENYSEWPKWIIPLDVHMEYSLFWFALFFTFSLFLKFISREGIDKISKFLVFSWIVTYIPPLVDPIIYFGRAFRMTYIYREPLQKFLTFYSTSPFGREATIGIRIEITLVVILASLYVATKTRNWFKTVLAGLGGYSIAFFYMAMPVFYKGLKVILGFSPTMSYPREYVDFLIYIMLVLVPIYLSMYKKKERIQFIEKFFELIDFKRFKVSRVIIVTLIRNIRPFRLIHYTLLSFFGMFVAYRFDPGVSYSFHVMKIIPLILSMAFAWLFALQINDIFDIKIDEISNQRRPLIKKLIDRENYKIYSVIFFILSLFFASLINFAAANMISYFMVTYSFIYSAPPLRLRRFLFIPNAIIGLCSVLAVLFGFSAVADSKTFALMPWHYSFFIFLIYTFASTMKDIKDYKGDKVNKIDTLPTVLGLILGKKIIGLFIATSFVFMGILISWILPLYPKNWLILLTVVFAALGYLFTVEKNEKWLFSIEYIYLAVVLSTVIWQ